MTKKQRDALRMLREHGDPVIGLGGGVVTTAATALFDGQPWINWRTALALQRLGLAEVHGYGAETEITLMPLAVVSGQEEPT